MANTQDGAVFIYDDAGTLLHMLTSPAPPSSNRFGLASVATDGDIIAFSAIFDNPGGTTSAGTVQLFDINRTPPATLSRTKAAQSELLGDATAIEGDLVAASKRRRNDRKAGIMSAPRRGRFYCELGRAT